MLRRIEATRQEPMTDHAPAMPAAQILAQESAGVLTLAALGDWVVTSAAELDRSLQALRFDVIRSVIFDLGQLTRLDTAGAWLIHRTRRAAEAAGARVSLIGVDRKYESLIRAVAERERPAAEHPRHANILIQLVERSGRALVEAWQTFVEGLGFLGLLMETFARTIAQPWRFRFTSTIFHMEQAGVNAVPIVALMSFLIGAVLAYQGVEQLRRFGGESFTVNLVGITFLREVGVLLTAILVAGRSGSAFTAQIGSMKLREEIDAMRTLGLDPMEVLVLPRVLALVIMLPMLGFISAMMGLAGGGFVLYFQMDMSPWAYVDRILEAVGFWTFMVGIIKAPVFGLLIALIGCFEGLKVEGSAESVGQRTTQSVVEGIFVVIVADAFFSILFVELGI